MAVAGGHSGQDVEIVAPHDHVDILGKALIAMMDRRPNAHNCQGDAFLARERLERRQSLGKLRFLLFLAFTAATTLSSSSQLPWERQ